MKTRTQRTRQAENQEAPLSYVDSGLARLEALAKAIAEKGEDHA